MKKGMSSIVASTDSKVTAIKSLEVGQSMLVGVADINDFTVQKIASHSDFNNGGSLWFGVVNPDEVGKTLFDKAVNVLWEDWRNAGTADEKKAIQNKINAAKLKENAYFGMTDLSTGEHMILGLGWTNPKEIRGANMKGGNKFFNALKDNEEELTQYPLQIKNEGMGNWTVKPYIKKLSAAESEAFANLTEVPVEVYEDSLNYLTAERQVEFMNKFATTFQFDLGRIGVEVTAEQESSNYGF